MSAMLHALPSSLWCFLAASAALTNTWASPVDHAEKSLLQRRQDQAAFAVTGLSGQGIQPRLEVRDLQQNKDQWNMYLLGLQSMQGVNQDDMLSWFQIAGIHGAPFIAWDGVTGDPSGGGYCTHDSSLFLSWHRPYLALYENIVVSHAIDIANEWPEGAERTRYVNAASTLRIPYWDWATPAPSGGHTIPDSMTSQQITVNTPNGSQRIANPLYSYKFHPVDSRLGSKFTQTYRHPVDSDRSHATTRDNDGEMIDELDGNQEQLAQRLFNLFANYNDYMSVGNEAWYPDNDASKYDSFESVHDNVHVMIGGGNGGNMDIIQVSAFDPVFWLHHTMIDRLFAMWQALYPDSYLEPQSQAMSTFWYKAGSTQDVNSPLKPFYADGDGNFHTSASVRNLSTFGYIYPELTSGDPADVRGAINTLYGDGGSSNNEKREAKIANATESNKNPRQYMVNIRADKVGQNDSYAVRIFLGDFTADPNGWASDPNLVGTYSVFAKQMNKEAVPVPVSGVVVLNKRLRVLYAEGKLGGLTQKYVIPYLKKNLHWRVQKLHGREIDRKSMRKLKISVVSTQVEPAASAHELDKWVGKFTVHTDVTDGKPAGLNKGDHV